MITENDDRKIITEKNENIKLIKEKMITEKVITENDNRKK